MGQAAYLGLCLLGCLIFNPVVEGAKNGSVADRARCSPGALYYRQFCYTFDSYAVSWHLAEVNCQEQQLAMESHLASILSPNEGKIVSSFLSTKGFNDIWIGLEATRSNGYMIWEWSDVSPVSSPLWDGRNLSGAISANECVSMTNIKNINVQKWLQRPCTDTLPYLCKYRADY